MKTSFRTLLLVGLVGASSALAQVTIGWNFTDLNGTFDTGTPLNFSISALTIGNSFGTVAAPFSSTSPSSGAGAYTGNSGTGNVGNAQRTGALATGASGSGYLEFTVTPFSGYQITLSDFDFGVRSTATAAQAYSLRSNSDSFGSDIVTGTIANNSQWAFKNNSFSSTVFSVDQAVTFRLFGYNGTGSPGSGTINSRFDDISVTLGATAIPEPSTYAAILGGVALVGVVGARRRRGAAAV